MNLYDPEADQRHQQELQRFADAIKSGGWMYDELRQLEAFRRASERVSILVGDELPDTRAAR